MGRFWLSSSFFYSNFLPRTSFVFKLISKKATQDVCSPIYCFVCNIAFYTCLLLFNSIFIDFLDITWWPGKLVGGAYRILKEIERFLSGFGTPPLLICPVAMSDTLLVFLVIALKRLVLAYLIYILLLFYFQNSSGILLSLSKNLLQFQRTHVSWQSRNAFQIWSGSIFSLARITSPTIVPKRILEKVERCLISSKLFRRSLWAGALTWLLSRITVWCN